MPSITSANIACGFHAGDPSVMRQTIAAGQTARRCGGRPPGVSRSRRIRPPGNAALDWRGRGPRALSARRHGWCRGNRRCTAAACQGARRALQHGRARQLRSPRAIARAVAAFDRTLILFGLPNSALLREGEAAGLRVAAEVFADRTYEADGSLTSRRVPGSVIQDPASVVARAVDMVSTGQVIATDGAVVPLHADTICLHGDTPGAADLARHFAPRWRPLASRSLRSANNSVIDALISKSAAAARSRPKRGKHTSSAA